MNPVFFSIRIATERNELLPLEIDKIQGEMFHRFPRYQAEV